MSRNIEFYHGTNQRFAPGDLILPRSVTGAQSAHHYKDSDKNFNQPDVAYATEDRNAADVFAGATASVYGGEPYVYRVTPINGDDLTYDYGVSDGSAYASKTGFKVLREVK